MVMTGTITTTKNPNELPNGRSSIKHIDMGVKDEINSIENNHKIIKEIPYKMEIVWPSVITFLMMHLGALYAIYLCFFEAKFLTAVFDEQNYKEACIVAGVFMVYFKGMSITMGAHRFYSHRTFKANKYIQVILVLVHTMAAQRTLLTWVRDHRTHHKYSDTDADPHNSSRGFFFSHIGWLLVRRHPDVIIKGKTIDVSDLIHNPIVMFQKNHYLKIFVTFGIILPTSIPCLLWNETVWNSFFISFVFGVTGCWNITWLINSATHLYGSRPYNKDIAPRENPFVSIITLGEGMHNYHHTFPWDYRTAEYSNITTRIIDYCMKKGWIYDAKTISQEFVKQQTIKKGDGSHLVYKKLNPNGVSVSENY